jgi:hypothetical protein
MTIKNYMLPGKPIQPPAPTPKDPEEDIIRNIYRHKIQFDNKPIGDIVKSVSKTYQVRPDLLLSSAIQEGMNKAVSNPDAVSEAYLLASEKQGLDKKSYPVDGFYNYGLDMFGAEYGRLKKHLPAGFDKKFKTFKASNEVDERNYYKGVYNIAVSNNLIDKEFKKKFINKKTGKVNTNAYYDALDEAVGSYKGVLPSKKQSATTAAFMTNEDALIAKAAMLKDVQNQVEVYAKKNGVKIDDADKDYFVLAAYNSGLKNAKIMMNEYAKAKDRKGYIERGETEQKEVHNNISPRLKRLKFIKKLLSEG